MDKTPVEIKENARKHLKRIIEETSTTQKEFADNVGRSEVWVSGMVNGSSPITEGTAKKINERYPDYSVDYIMGTSDYPNSRDEFIGRVELARREGKLLEMGFYAFAAVSGFSVVLTSPAPVASDGTVDVEKKIAEVEGGYTITRGKQSIQISLEDMNGLQNEAADFVDFKLGRLLGKRG